VPTLENRAGILAIQETAAARLYISDEREAHLMKFELYGRTITIEDDLVTMYNASVHPLTQDEIEYLAETCRFKEGTTTEEIERGLDEAMQECIDIQSAMPAIIREAEKHGIIQ
jgi:hypothetical protein